MLDLITSLVNVQLQEVARLRYLEERAEELKKQHLEWKLQLLKKKGLGSLAPKKRERVLLQQDTFNGEVTQVKPVTIISNLSNVEKQTYRKPERAHDKYWSTTPHSARKRWRKDHPKWGKALAKRQGLTK